MALDPRISLAAQTANTGEAFSNALLNVQRLQGIQQQPLRNQLLESQVGQAQLENTQAQEQARLSSLITGAAELQPLIADAKASGDVGPLVRALGERRARLVSEGRSTSDTDEAFDMLGQGIEGLGRLDQATNNLMELGFQTGVLDRPAARTGLASAKTEILPDGSVIQALPNGEVQVRNPQGEIVTGDERLAVLRQSRQEGLDIKKLESGISVFEAQGKAEATQRASRVSQITSELSTRNRESKRTGIKLNRALNLAGKATQGLTGAAKVKLARIFPDLDVSDESSLEQSLKLLSLDQLQKFKGPTTDFEFRVTEDIAGKLGDSRSANIARIKSLQRAEWFNQREFEQFIEHTKAGKSPDTFGFNFSEQIKTKKGSFSLQDIQDTAVDGNLTIEETIKRLNQ